MIDKVARHGHAGFGVLGKKGYWLAGFDGDEPVWAANERQVARFDTAVEACRAVRRIAPDIWSFDAPRAMHLDVADGFPAVIETCAWCDGSGRVVDDLDSDERYCMSCSGYGQVAIWALSTVQLSWGGLFDAIAADNWLIHLVRDSVRGGAPGQLLCGIDFRAKGGPGYSVGGGISATGIDQKPCPGCAAGARENFGQLPITRGVGGRIMAEHLGVPCVDSWLPSPAPEHDVMAARREVSDPRQRIAVAA